MRLFRTVIVLFIISIMVLGTYYEENSSSSSLKVENFPVQERYNNSSISNIFHPYARQIFRSYGSYFTIRGIAQCEGIEKISKNITIEYSIKILKQSLTNFTFSIICTVTERGDGTIFSRNYDLGSGTYEIEYEVNIDIGNITSNQSRELNSLIPPSMGLIRIIPTSDRLLLESGTYAMIASLFLLIIFNFDSIFKRMKK